MVDTTAVMEEIWADLCGEAGLTETTIAACPTLLALLRTTNPAEALRRLTEAIEDLPDDETRSALQNVLRLDPSVPPSLIGPYGRRAAFARAHSTREDIVRAWEQQAAEALTSMLIARSRQHIDEIAVIFFVEDKQIVYKSETRFWVDEPPQPGQRAGTINARIATRNIRNEGNLLLGAGLYQLAADEHPSALEIYLVFPDNQLPTIAFSTEAPDIFALTTNNVARRDLGRPHAAVSLLGDELEPGGDQPVFSDMSGWIHRIEQPQDGGIYGIAWLYS